MSSEIIPESVEIVLMLSMLDAILLRADREDGAVPVDRVVEVTLSHRRIFSESLLPVAEGGPGFRDEEERSIALVFDAHECECNTAQVSIMYVAGAENHYLPFERLVRAVAATFGIDEGMARQVIAQAALAAAQLEGLPAFGALAAELSHGD